MAAQRHELVTALVLLACCHLATSQQSRASAPPSPAEGSDYLDLRPDGGYNFGYNTGDVGQHAHTASADRFNRVNGRWRERGRLTQYSAGPRGFRARGDHIARRMDLSQNRIPYRPPVSPDSPDYKPTYSGYHDPNEDPSYKFGFRTPGHDREEESFPQGDIKGRYSYIDDAGERHEVDYIAGARTGFLVTSAHPDSNGVGGSLFVQAPPGRLRPGDRGFPRGRSAISRGSDGSYQFISAGPNQRRTEGRDASGVVRGSYSYLDDKGVQRTTEYIAGPNIGYKVLSSRSGSPPYLPPAPVPPVFVPSLPQSSVFTSSSVTPLFEGTPSSAIPAKPTQTTTLGLGGNLFESAGSTNYPTDDQEGGNAGSNASGGTVGGGGLFQTGIPTSTKPVISPTPGSLFATDEDLFGAGPPGGSTVGPGSSSRPSSRPPAVDGDEGGQPGLRPSDDDLFGGLGGSGYNNDYQASDRFDLSGKPTPKPSPSYGSALGDTGASAGDNGNLFGSNDDLFGGFGGGNGGTNGGGQAPPGGSPSLGSTPSSTRPTSAPQGSDDLFGSGGSTVYGSSTSLGTTPGVGGGSSSSRVPYKDCCTVRPTSAPNSFDTEAEGGGFSGFPPGVAVRAHVQSLDILPYGHRIPPPGLALDDLYNGVANGRRRSIQSLLSFSRG